MPCVIVYGNPIDGFELIGQFDNGAEAYEWADANDLEGDWWVVKIVTPESFKKR